MIADLQVRRSDAPPQPRLHRHRPHRPHPRDRRDDDDVLGDQCRAAAAAALSRCRSGWSRCARRGRRQASRRRSCRRARYLDWTRGSRVLQDAAIVDSPGLAVAIDNSRRCGSARCACRPSSSRSSACSRWPDAPSRATPSSRAAVTSSSSAISVWQERFAGAADVVGRTVRVEGRPTDDHRDPAGGILIHGRAGPRSSRSRSTPDLLKETDHAYDVYARLAPGVTREQAGAEVNRIALATEGSGPPPDRRDARAAAAGARRRRRDADAGDVRRGRIRAADRLRQHRQPAAGARRRAAARDRDPRRARRRARAASSASC